MREIKFRAWDNVDYMSTPFTLTDIQEKKIQFTSDVIIMQFAGLKDKNGKEIYEGDIVTCEITEREINYDDDPRPRKVYYDSECAGFYPFIKGSQWRSSVDNIVLIGNIYENPDLLK